MTRKLLVAYDFSPSADAAIAHAAREARETHATIDVVHVLPLPVPLDGAAVVSYPSPTELEDVRRQLQDAIKRLGFDAPCHVVVGVSIGETLLALARERSVEQLIVGTRGRGPIRRALLGSVADYLVRHADCPVTTVRAPQQEALREAAAH
jgi:nucleotide-binding universal stress UspA family protein